DNEVTFKGLTIQYRYIPSQKLGGDYFNVIQLADNKIGIFLSDVMGHGVAASLITMVLKTLFDNHVHRIDSPSDFLFTLNNELQKIFGEILIYATAIYIIVDQKNRKLYYANGAHPPALLYNNTKSDIMQLQCQGTILGIFKDTKYKTIEMSYEPNDQIFLYTDGLTDVENIQEEPFGDERLLKIVGENKELAPKELIETLLENLYQFASDESFEDDINILCVRLDD
ncbi:MAG TPA: serine/threonine-protein phosphatase, partial [Spirochaetes bacterium]|nr:serine/threonine-protein phosphatase [Spirochaetota bacterium]